MLHAHDFADRGCLRLLLFGRRGIRLRGREGWKADCQLIILSVKFEHPLGGPIVKGFQHIGFDEIQRLGGRFGGKILGGVQKVVIYVEIHFHIGAVGGWHVAQDKIIRNRCAGSVILFEK